MHNMSFIFKKYPVHFAVCLIATFFVSSSASAEFSYLYPLDRGAKGYLLISLLGMMAGIANVFLAWRDIRRRISIQKTYSAANYPQPSMKDFVLPIALLSPCFGLLFFFHAFLVMATMLALAVGIVLSFILAFVSARLVYWTAGRLLSSYSSEYQDTWRSQRGTTFVRLVFLNLLLGFLVDMITLPVLDLLK